MGPPSNCVMRTFLVATSKRDTKKYPHPSSFTYELPVTLRNIVGIAIRDFKFGAETLINENNKTLLISNAGADAELLLDVGDYNNNISELINKLNVVFSLYNIVFSIDGITKTVRIVYTGETYVIIHPSSVLRILGFPNGKNMGICMYANTGVLPNNLSESVIMGSTTLIAPNKYDVYTLAEMVVRITDVETILSNDAVTNRCTAVLFNSNTNTSWAKQCLDHYIPLLQQQSRLQSLRIQLLNMEGDLYDTINNEALMLLEFYCVD